MRGCVWGLVTGAGLMLAAQYQVRDNPVEAQAGAFRFPTMEKRGGQYSLALNELLWDGGRRGLAVTMADRQTEAQRLGGLASVQQAQLAAVEVYLGALELNGSREVLDRRLETLEAADLFNLLRNEGGSVGIALSSTILARHTQLHRSHLVENLTPGNPLLNERIVAMSHGLGAAAGTDPATSQQLAWRAMSGQLDAQAKRGGPPVH